MRYCRRKLFFLGNFSSTSVCICVCVCVVWDKLSITFVPDCYGHLSSHSGSSGTLLFNAGLIYLTPRASPLFLFPFVLSSPSFSLSLSDTHPSTHLLLKGHRERKREMAPVIFPSFKWDSAALSVTEPLRGGHPAKEEPFTLYCILLQRAHISFHTLSICLSTSFFFLHFSHIPSIHLFVLLCCLPYIYFWFYILWSLKAWQCPLSMLACQKHS